jgi:hypothetical protein
MKRIEVLLSNSTCATTAGDSNETQMHKVGREIAAASAAAAERKVIAAAFAAQASEAAGGGEKRQRGDDEGGTNKAKRPKDSAGGKEKKRRKPAQPAPPGGKKVRVKNDEVKGAGAALLAGAGPGAGNGGSSIIPHELESFAWEPNVTGDCRPKDVLVPFTYTTDRQGGH